MKTKYVSVTLLDQPEPSHPLIIEAAEVIRHGGIVALPTETVYGLAADATSTEAVERIFKAKGRPADNPLIVHISDRAQLEGWVEPPGAFVESLMDRFWPGPLTIVLPLQGHHISPLVTAGLQTVAVRMPDHPVALSIIQAAGRPLAAPSANSSGHPSPTKAEHVKQDLDGKIDMIVDGGSCGVGLESTVIAVHEGQIEWLRPGMITIEHMVNAGFIKKQPYFTTMEHTDQTRPRSPGMKYKHYAPQGLMTIVRGQEEQQVMDWIQKEVEHTKEQQITVGVLTFTEHANFFNADLVVSYGSVKEPEQWARQLYDSIRAFDLAHIERIYVEACSDQGVGHAVLNRLLKASQYHIIEV